jgi:cellulose biosynthesis protein BcsQ
MYTPYLQKHNIANIFLMVEQYEEGETGELNINRLFKYSSIKEIFNEIIGKSAGALNVHGNAIQETQIVLVTSANGGAGKTTVAMGMAACLSQNHKKVLYINASKLQMFQHHLNNQTAISSQEVYSKLMNPGDDIYRDIKHVIRFEQFYYLPAFKAALMSIGVPFNVYEKIALSAKNSKEYDFIIIDAESSFDEDTIRLYDIADKIVIVTGQSDNTVHATNILISNLNCVSPDKYIFVCNKFAKEEYNALISPSMIVKFSVNEYIDAFDSNGAVSCKELSEKSGIRKTAFLIV